MAKNLVRSATEHSVHQNSWYDVEDKCKKPADSQFACVFESVYPTRITHMFDSERQHRALDWITKERDKKR